MLRHKEEELNNLEEEFKRLAADQDFKSKGELDNLKKKMEEDHGVLLKKKD